MPSSTTCTFPSPRGHQLSARLERPAGAPRGAAIFAHCFTCSKDLPVARALTRALSARGFVVLSFDFTGLGNSDGDFAESTFSADVEDLRAAADYLAEVAAPPSLLVGHSLGGAAVLSAAPDLPSVRAVATIAAPADPAHVRQVLQGDVDAILRDGSAPATIGGRTFTIGRSFLDDLERQEPLKAIAGFAGATLILHSPIDQVVGIDNAEAIYRAARHPKSFISLDKADHLLTDEADVDYAATVIAAWAQRYLDDAGAGPATPDPDRYRDIGASAVNSGDLTTRLRARGFTLLADEPTSAGGDELGPTPYDYLTMALAACTSMTLRMYGDRKGWPLDEVETVVTHERLHADDCAECEHKEGYIDLLSRTIRLAGDLDADQRAAFLRIADRCPVHRTLEGRLEIRTLAGD
ncbi:MAG: alpha/beta fold hydrolase [Micrococcales bacterium]|nr:alpha/beta fold hydrolase [Micrococcales bacterium]